MVAAPDGGVAHKPWRAEKAEATLRNQPATTASFEAAAHEALLGAKTYRENGFKVELAKRAIVRALTIAGGVA